MDFDTPLVRKMMEIGMLASGHGFVEEAESIFSGLQEMRPEREEPIIGRALLKMNTGKPDEAVRILRDEAIKKNPKSDLAHAYLALALKLAGQVAEGLKVAEELSAKAENSEALRLAKAILEEVAP